MAYPGYNNGYYDSSSSSSYPSRNPPKPYASSGFSHQPLSFASYDQQQLSPYPYTHQPSSSLSPSQYPTDYAPTTGSHSTAKNVNYASSHPMRQSISNSSSGSSQSKFSGYGYAGSSSTSSPSDGGYQDYPGIELQQCTIASSSKGGTSKGRKHSSAKDASSKGEKPYICLEPGCEFRTAREFDLKRHMKNHFEPAPEDMFPCPGKNCVRVGKYAFKRKDHMMEHVANFHHGYINGKKVIENKKGKGGKKEHGGR